MICRDLFIIFVASSAGISLLLNIRLFLIVHINHMASVILSMNASLIHLGFFLNCIDPLISSIVGCSHWVFGKVCSQHANFRDAVYWASASAWAVFRYLASWDRS